MRFLDANVFLRFLTRDDEAKAEACYQLFEGARRGEEELFTCEAIITEVVYVLSSPRAPYRLSRGDIRSRLLPLLTLQGLKIPQGDVYLRALDLYTAHGSLDFEDAVAIAHMEQQGLTTIVSYDRDFDLVAGVEKVEP